MKAADLIKTLARLKVQTGSLACLGCGYERNCGLHGCALIRAVVDRLRMCEENTGWIDANERLPEPGVPVLVYSKWGHITIEELRTWDKPPHFVGGLKPGRDVLFWRPLPEKPDVLSVIDAKLRK